MRGAVRPLRSAAIVRAPLERTLRRDSPSMPVTVAVDAMGGDHGPAVTIPAALDFLDATPDTRVILVGLEDPIRRALAKAPRRADGARRRASRRARS